jgi:uncharacterized protein YciI
MSSANESVFIVLSQYLQSPDVIAQYYDQHAAFLAPHYASGRILGSGKQVPAVGGCIVLRAESVAEVRAILAEDPFQIHGCAAYWVFEFTPNPPPRRNPALDAWLHEPLTNA